MSTKHIPRRAHLTYQLQYRKCGKPNCRCASGNIDDLHGPYHYAYATIDGKLQSFYCGHESEPVPPDAWDKALERDIIYEIAHH